MIKFSKELICLYFSIFLFAAAFGIDVVTFPTILSKHHSEASQIGIAFTADVCGGVLMSFFLSRFVAYFGMMRALKISAFIYAAAIALIYFYQNFYLWICFTFTMGIFWLAYNITRQAWLNMFFTPEQRGVGLGIFSLVLAFGLGTGPLIVSFSGANSYSSFLISAALVVASFYCLLPLHKQPKINIESKRIPLLQFLKNNPRCFLGRFFLDFQTYLLFTFTVIYGRSIGLSYEAAGLLITSYLVSGICDLGVGFMLKKISAYKMVNIGFIICIFSFLLIILYNISYVFLLLMYFIFGIGIGCIYVSIYKICNDDYEKEKLVAANATFQLIGSSGSICGSLIGGYMLDIFGNQGFPITMVLSCVLYLSFLVIYDKNFAK